MWDLQSSLKAEQLQAFRILMTLREYCSAEVYKDTRGRLTVGIGHLVMPQDHLHVDDVIDQARIDHLFAEDASTALAAARAQAEEAGIESMYFIPYLASVNFQLGTKWTRKFPNTWQMIVNGDYAKAAEALGGTLWQHQTPCRVADFQTALRNLPSLALTKGPAVQMAAGA